MSAKKYKSAVWELTDYEYRPFGRTGKALYFTLTSALVPAGVDINKMSADIRARIEGVSIPRCICYREDNGTLHIKGPSFKGRSNWVLGAHMTRQLKLRILDMIQSEGLDAAIGLEAILP